MIISQDLKKWLMSDSGEMGIVEYEQECSPLKRREGTIEVLRQMNADTIVHFGCCGHMHNIDKQLKNNTHFHAMLTKEFKQVIGFDINSDAVKHLNEKGFSNVFDVDLLEEYEKAEKILNSNIGEKSDICFLLPEVLEHIPNPALFLNKISELYGNHGKNRIVITVPSAYGFGRIKDALFRNSEHINLDHKFMFTPTTLLSDSTLWEA